MDRGDSFVVTRRGVPVAELKPVSRRRVGRRAVDLLIAATAVAHGLALYTRNAGDLDGLDSLLEVVDAAAAA